MDFEIVATKYRLSWVTCVFVGLLSLATSLYCLTIIKVTDQLSPLWLATTLMTIVVFRYPLRSLPLLLGSCLIGMLLADILIMGSERFDIRFLFLNVLQAIVGGLSIRLLLDPEHPLDTLSSWLKMLLSVGLFAPCIAAALACIILDMPTQSLSQIFSSWIASEMIGMLTLGPIILLWKKDNSLNYRIIIETVITLLGTLVLCWLAMRYLPWPFVSVIVILFYSAVRLPRLAAFIIYFMAVSMISLMQTLDLIPQMAALPLPLYTSWLPLLWLLIPSHLMTLVMHSFRRERQHIEESEMRFRHAMEFSAIGMALVSPGGRWLQVNPSLCKLLGYSAAELAGMTVRQISYPEDLPAHFTQRSRLLTDEISSYRMEKRYLRKDGAVVWTMVTSSLVRDNAQQPLYFIAQIQDITDIRQLTEALHQEKERMLITLDSIDEAVISTDDQMRVIFMNPVAEKITGWQQQHATGKPIHEILSITRHYGDTMQEITLCCSQPKHASIVAADEELLLHNRAGEQFAINYSLSPLSTKAGKSIGCVMVIQDVSESRAILRNLRYSASHDMLTGLPNRSNFLQQLKQLLSPQHSPLSHHVLAFIDLDHFKAVNDNGGHAAGDTLLQELANVMSRQLRSNDLLARIGGDEFALLLPDCSPEDAAEITGRLVKAIEQYRLLWQGAIYAVGASAGLTSFNNEHDDNTAEIMAQADIACYQAKKQGRGQIIFWPVEH